MTTGGQTRKDKEKGLNQECYEAVEGEKKQERKYKKTLCQQIWKKNM